MVLVGPSATLAPFAFPAVWSRRRHSPHAARCLRSNRHLCGSDATVRPLRVAQAPLQQVASDQPALVAHIGWCDTVAIATKAIERNRRRARFRSRSSRAPVSPREVRAPRSFVHVRRRRGTPFPVGQAAVHFHSGIEERIEKRCDAMRDPRDRVLYPIAFGRDRSTGPIVRSTDAARSDRRRCCPRATKGISLRHQRDSTGSNRDDIGASTLVAKQRAFTDPATRRDAGERDDPAGGRCPAQFHQTVQDAEPVSRRVALPSNEGPRRDRALVRFGHDSRDLLGTDILPKARAEWLRPGSARRDRDRREILA